MQTIARSETEAVTASRNAKSLLKAGAWYPAEIRGAIEKVSARDNDMIETELVVFDTDGSERQFRDWLVDTPRGAAKLRHACEAAGVLDRYEAGEISASSFRNKCCRVQIGIEKKRGYPDRNVIEDYGVADAVVNLRAAGAQ